ncbi:P-loop containing nucleoside triphosphate hydrolase protein [Tuber brumale]|nr:P-loop containing nucleoside triphosphate hydrolase protein [Tuber brumale]
MDPEPTRLEDHWRGNINIQGDYSGNTGSSNNISTPNYRTHGSFNASAPTHWRCPHRGNRNFIPQEGSIEGILARPSATLAGLRGGNFGGIAFCGPPGAGKTEVAIQLIERYRWHTYDVFWVNASTPNTLTKDFQYISDLLKSSASSHTNFLNRAGGRTLLFARSTHERLPIPEDPTGATTAIKTTDDSTTVNDISSCESLLSVVKSELESPSRQSWLLVLDNLTDETVITEFLPKSLNGLIIVTTRSLHLASGLGCRAVEVPRMSPANAVLLFKIYYFSPESETNQDEAMELMELLEHLPARVIDAALHMNEKRVLVREYLAELKAARRLFGLGRIYGRWNGAAAAGCFAVFLVLLAWAIGFRRG